MDIDFTNLHIHIPKWLLIIFLAIWLVQAVLAMINAYYRLKLARLKAARSAVQGGK